MMAARSGARTARSKARGAQSPLTRPSSYAGLLLLLLVAVIVIWRRGTGITMARDLSTLEHQQRLLVAQRTTLEREINDALSRSRIVQAAERRLGMHVASESETRALIRADAIVETTAADAAADAAADGAADAVTDARRLGAGAPPTVRSP